MKKEAIYDWARLRNYNPPAAITALASDDTMTGYGRHMFYINHPAVETKAAFNQDCPNNGGEQTIILGCYRTHQMGIYLYSVSDPKFDGVEEVTAAHEMLHAAYERLGQSDKNYVNGLLMDYYRHGLHDKRLLDTVASYQKTEPNAVVDEMHSIFGTEVPNLPPKLEDYYHKYFKDRSQVTAFAAKYQSVFTARKLEAQQLLTQIHFDEQQLVNLKNQIDSMEHNLEVERQNLEPERHSGTDAATYNAQVSAYNQQVSVYRGLVASYNQLIIEHNDLVNQYNAINVQTSQLLQELNSRAPTITTQ